MLFAFSQLAADNEVTAMRASGVSLAQLVGPVLVAALAMSACTFVFVDQVLPRSNARLRNLYFDIARKKPTFELHEQIIGKASVNEDPNTTLVGDFDGNGEIDVGFRWGDGRNRFYLQNGFLNFTERFDPIAPKAINE